MKKLKITIDVYDDHMFEDDATEDEIHAYVLQFIEDIENALEHTRGCINDINYNVVEKIIL